MRKALMSASTGRARLLKVLLCLGGLFIVIACQQHLVMIVRHKAKTQKTADVPTLVKVVALSRPARETDICKAYIRVENVADLYGVELHLTFNPDVVEIVDEDSQVPGVQIAHGDFLSPDFIVRNQVDNAKGTVTYVVMQVAPRQSASGDGTLAALQFRRKMPMLALVEASEVLLADYRGRPIPVQVEVDTF